MHHKTHAPHFSNAVSCGPAAFRCGEKFIASATEVTDALWAKLQEMQRDERAKCGVLDMDTDVVSSITSYAPGCLDKSLEKIVGLQTDKPL